MAYIGTTPTKVVSRQSVVDYRYTATAGQTAFTGADLNNQVLACNPADMDVHLNGVRLDATDWTATATTLTLAVAASAGDEVTVAVRQTFEVADTYAKTTADDRFVNAAGDTMSGQLTFSGDGVITVANTANGLYLGGSAVAPNTTKVEASALVAARVNGIDRLSIDASGRVTMPYQPAFHAMASNGNNISSGTVPYANVTFNRGGHYNSSTSRFTAPVSGAYQFHASCYSHSGTGTSVSAKISVNGVMRQVGEVAEVGGNFGWDGINMSVIVELNAGDYVSVDWRAGAQLHVNPNNNSFSGALIG